VTRGTLRIYLGAAPGVGKTFAMLDEARRRADRGSDVVVGYVETHGRARTAEKVRGLEVIPRRTIVYRDCAYEEMDLQGVLRRRPQIVCVDELAHTNIPGAGHAKRWQDVEDLLAAGITVLTTVNIQHLESVNDVVEKITGIRQQETLPDAIVRGADQVELVDITPEALRRRMAHGNIYPAERVDAALSNYFRVGNLTALRELALLWLADKVDDALRQYRHDHEIEGTWETRERVVVGLSGGPEGSTLIRRAARIAARGGADLLAVHITRSDGLTGANPADLAMQRQLVESLGGTFHQVVGDHVPDALLDFARSQNATQLVMGASRRPLLATYFGGPGIGATTVRLSGDIDVHIVTHEHAGRGRRLPELSSGLTLRRRLIGSAVAAALLPITTVVLANLRGGLNLTSDLLCYLLVVVAISLVGGAFPGIGTAVVASLLLNYYFTPPLYRWTIAEGNNVIALIAFVVVAAAVSAVVDLAARRTSQAARAVAESQTLGTLAGSVLRGQPTMPALLERLVEALSLSSASLLERADEKPGPWRVIASVGPDRIDDPEGADASAGADHVTLAVRGRPLDAADQRMLSMFAVQAALALEQQRLSEAAAAAEPLAEADRMRTALLSAVSHDLRSPLASATAAVDSLSNSDIEWTPEQRADLVATARESLDQLGRLVDNLLDMSRLQAGALSVFPQPTRLDEVVPLALDSLGPAALAVEIDVPASLPEVSADPALLERVIANVAANAIRYASGNRAARVAASAHNDRVELRVIDYGPGVPSTEWERIFTPFQRLGDTDNTVGVGLGLALARGLAEAMGGHLTPEETPGGGLTLVLDLPAVVIGQPVSVLGDEVRA
jgi:two-component system sensor histidine kinase KdpD